MLAAFGERLWDLWPLRVVDPWEVGIRTFWGEITGPVEPGVRAFCPMVGGLRRAWANFKAVRIRSWLRETNVPIRAPHEL